MVTLSVSFLSMRWARAMTKSIVSACIGKQRYDTELEALETAKHIRKEQSISLSVYHCGVCLGWHLTRRQTKRRKR